MCESGIPPTQAETPADPSPACVDDKIARPLPTRNRSLILRGVWVGVFVIVVSALSIAFCFRQDYSNDTKAGIVITFAVVNVVVLGSCLIWSLFWITRNSIYRAHLSEIRAGHYIARWEYTAEQRDAIVAHLERKARSIPLIFIALSFLTWALVLVVGYDASSRGGYVFEFVAGALLICLVLGGAIGAIAYGIRLRKIKNWRQQSGETVIGWAGLYWDGHYHPFDCNPRKLMQLKPLDDAGMRLLRFGFWQRGGAGSDSTGYFINVEVPIPFEQMDALEDIIRCVQDRRHLASSHSRAWGKRGASVETQGASRSS